MRYKSTRDSSLKIPFSEVLLGGLSYDGGLYMPERTPFFNIDQINDFKTFTYQELTAELLYPFLSEDLSSDEFKEIVDNSYQVFESEEVVNLVNLGEQRWILELFHGPTLAFKDIAMQLLGGLLEHFAKKEAKK